MKIVAFSDTHAHHREVTLPDGDVLVFGGDLMTCGRKFAEVQSFAQWFGSQPHKYKILVAGNHDRLFESKGQLCVNEFVSRWAAENTTFHYLNDSGCEIGGIQFWGSPYQPWFYDWAFNVHRGPEIKKHWDKIPADTDVLITHGPPMGYLDVTDPRYGGEHVGCEELTLAVKCIKPRVHIFGHIHNGFGVEETSDTNFHNVSICNEDYEAVNHPHQIYIERK